MTNCTCQYKLATKFIDISGIKHSINCKITRINIKRCINYGLNNNEKGYFYGLTNYQVNELRKNIDHRFHIFVEK